MLYAVWNNTPLVLLKQITEINISVTMTIYWNDLKCLSQPFVTPVTIICDTCHPTVAIGSKLWSRLALYLCPLMQTNILISHYWCPFFEVLNFYESRCPWFISFGFVFLLYPNVILIFPSSEDSECEIKVCGLNNAACKPGFTGENCNVGEWPFHLLLSNLTCYMSLYFLTDIPLI